MTGQCAIARLTLAWLLLPAAGRAQSGAIYGTVTMPTTGIRDVVVYLVPTEAPGAPTVTPLAAEMDQRDLHFVPSVVVITPGSPIVFLNSDRVMHNVFHPARGRGGFDLGLWAPGQSRGFTLREEGAYLILCEVHPEMAAYIVVVASPYRTVTDAGGRFRFVSVAPGTYRLRTWHHWLETHEEGVAVPQGGSVQVHLRLKLGKPAPIP